MTPFHFGPPERRLVGLFHHDPANPAIASARAVLLCNPFGQEAVRSHRLYRILADRLTRVGTPVLRFDYHATGDAPGADEEGELEGWAADLRLALRELAVRSGAQQLICVGARLGATLAVQSARDNADIARLVLWDPIIQGADYLELLRLKHVEALESSFSLTDPSWRTQLANDPTAFTNEAIGFAISPTLRHQLTQIKPQYLVVPPGIDTHVLANSADGTVTAWLASLTAHGVINRHWPLEESFDWTAGERGKSPLVPPTALARLMAAICD